jgi:hypothetical protein
MELRSVREEDDQEGLSVPVAGMDSDTPEEDLMVIPVFPAPIRLVRRRS